MGSRSILVILVLGALAACNKVDTKKFEKDVQAKLEAGGVEGAKVTCPKNVSAKKGVKFTCQVEIEGTSYDYDVEILEVKGSDLDMNAGFSKGAGFPPKKLVELLGPQIQEKIGTEPTIDCGKEPLLFAEDGKIYCSITASGQTAKLRIDVDGADIKGWQVE